MGFLSSFSLLTPLYAAAGLAIGLPILFHLIRRTPRGRQVFSSVMFLTPAPPRITRRSRIDDWLLLLLRALAVLLIAAAFCRPLWRQLLAGDASAGGREVVLLLDASASMRRPDVWPAAQAELLHQVEQLTPGDVAAVLRFDDQITPILDRSEWLELPPAQRLEVLRTRLQDLTPGWGATELGLALRTAADRLQQVETAAGGASSRAVVVVSDLQEGSRWQSLQGFVWPEDISVQLARVEANTPPTNASLQLVGAPERGDPAFVRLRIANAADSARERFQVGWQDPFAGPEDGTAIAGAIDVYVPPGQSRVVRLPQQASDRPSGRARLTGDDQPFDNDCYVAWTARQSRRIAYLGPDAASDRDDMRFFVDPLFADTPAREITIIDGWADVAASAAAPSPAEEPALVIVTGRLDAADAPRAERFVRAGGCLLYVLRNLDAATTLFPLIGAPPAEVGEAKVPDYAMLREVDFNHPLFSSLNDPRFSDLSKVHIWRHRSFSAAALPQAKVLARFDDGDPALCEIPVGAGRVFVLACGWNRADSELAMWPKFVPIMNALLDSCRPSADGIGQLIVGDALPLATLASLRPRPNAVIDAEGARRTWDDLERDPRVRRPGLLRLAFTEANASSTAAPAPTLAVNLAAEESRTAPLGNDVLESLGVRMAPAAVESEAETSDPHREQVARGLLESRQKLWRWLLAAALAVLLLETLLAGRPGRLAEPAVE